MRIETSAPTRERVVILGAGPAGMSAALWIQQYGLEPVLLDLAPIAGGLQATSPYVNAHLLGHGAVPARVIADRFRKHLADERIRTWQARVSNVRVGDSVNVETDEGQSLEAGALVVATGTRFRKLEIPGEADAEQSGQIVSFALDSYERCRGKTGVIIGGGDNAFYMANLLAELQCTVAIVTRGEPRAQRLLREKALRHSTVQLLRHHRVEGVEPGVLRAWDGQGAAVELPAAFVINAIGYEPRVDSLVRWFPQIVRDNAGYLVVDQDGRTSQRWVWAAGDVCNPRHPCTATAVAQGTMAARDIEATLDGRHPW